MEIINVVKAFTLNLAGKALRIEAGIHKVEAEIANHWYTQAHAAELSEEQRAAALAAGPAQTDPPEGDPTDTTDSGAKGKKAGK